MNPISLAITIGDPLGIGPQITLKALADHPARDQLIVIGDRDLLQRQAAKLRLSLPRQIESVGVLPSNLAFGQISAVAGDASFHYVEHAITMALAGTVAGVVTAPIAKEAWHAAGHHFPGHTELLAARSGGVPVRMMLANAELRVVLVSIHLPLRQAIAELSSAAILQTIELTDRALQRAGIAQPRLAVAGVNPHAGEAGLFGREEIDIIAPAITQAKAAGIAAFGPFAPDTIFMRARGLAQFDAVIAMYHDQGLIPVKYLGIDNGVNITIGLPFVRTSPDHGTAFDLAGRADANGDSLADARSMRAAIDQALSLIRQPGAAPAWL